MEGLAGQALSQKVKAVKTPNPGPLNIHCSRPGGLEGLKGQALSQEIDDLKAWRLGASRPGS